MSSTRGSDVYSQLRNRAFGARAATDQLSQELAQLEERRQATSTARADALWSLARHYLPALDEQSVAKVFQEARREVEAVRARQVREIEAQRSALAALAATLAAREARLGEVTAALDAAVAERTALEHEVAERLRADATFAELAQRTAEAEQRLHRDEERSAEMQREAAAKLPAFERSRLFQYLVAREFGTSAYAAGGLTRRLDRWVARLVDYPVSKRSYDFLRVTPQLVAQEVERRREVFEPLRAEVEARSQAEAKAVGLDVVLARGEDLGRQRDALVDEMTDLQRNHRAQSEELARLESNEGPHYADALGRLRGVLEDMEQQALERRARATPETQDDALVAQIASTRRDEEALAAEAKELGERRLAADRRATSLERLVRRFRESNFDSATSHFRSLDLDAELAPLDNPGGSIDDVWGAIRRRQDFVRPASASVDSGAAVGSTGRVLLEVMGHVVAGALRASATRSVFRGGGGGGFRIGGGGFGGGGGGGGGFTRGSGF